MNKIIILIACLTLIGAGCSEIERSKKPCEKNTGIYLYEEHEGGWSGECFYPKERLKEVNDRLNALEARQKELVGLVGAVEWKDKNGEWTTKTCLVDNDGKEQFCNAESKSFVTGKTYLTKDKNRVEWVKLGCERVIKSVDVDWNDETPIEKMDVDYSPSGCKVLAKKLGL